MYFNVRNYFIGILYCFQWLFDGPVSQSPRIRPHLQETSRRKYSLLVACILMYLIMISSAAFLTGLWQWVADDIRAPFNGQSSGKPGLASLPLYSHAKRFWSEKFLQVDALAVTHPPAAKKVEVTDDGSCKCCAGEVMVCVLDFKRDVGLWHGVLTVRSYATVASQQHQ